jgi:tRNA 2-thiouridine synthesizing protein A
MEIDTTGMFCPVPILKASASMKKIRAGEELVILSDDPGILSDLPAYCAAHGHSYLGHTEEPGAVFRLKIKKKAESCV